jgi:hypothetical protein
LLILLGIRVVWGASLKKPLVLFAVAMIALIIVVVGLVFLQVVRIPYFQISVLGVSHSAVHWIGWAGTLYLAFATPVYPIVKRKHPHRMRKTLYLHVVGNLLAVFLVSVHFAHQVTRPASSYPDLGTGVVLYAAMVLLVASGMVLVSGVGKRLIKHVQFVHPALALTFYLVIAMHIIHGL